MTCTTCPYCGVGCGVVASPSGDVEGDTAHPANFGRLCSKGAALGETIDLEGRLLTPQIGGVPADWDTATALVARKFTEAIRDHGPDSVAFYVSGQVLTEDYYIANKLMKGYIGSANIDTNSRLCMASSVAGHKRAFGTDTVPGCYEDLEEADLVVLVGSNLAWCHPVLHQRIAAAKAARPGMTVVNVDPRRTATCQLADLHLRIAPDGDAALFNGLLAYLSAHGAVDEDYVGTHVNGFATAVAAAMDSDPGESGLSASELAAFYTLWAGTEKVVTVYSQGVNQSTCGSDKVNAILNCHLATGRIGRPGMGPFSVTGQPNAMGGREVGGLANMLANHLDIENPDHRATVQDFWQSPTICDTPGLKAVDLFQACADGRIKALLVMSTNPAVSLPDANGVVEAIANVPFVTVVDIQARTDTGDLADVLLPATGWGEKDGTVTNSERRISRQRAFLPVPGEARADWKILCDIGAAMGWPDAFTFETPADVFREYAQLSRAALSHGRDFDISGWAEISDAKYDTMLPTQWPVRQDGTSGGRFFAEGGFFHPDRKAKMLPITPPAQEDLPGWRLNSGRARDQWHTMTRTGKSPRLGRHLAEPYIEIHPDDAVELNLGLAELVRIRNGAHSGLFRALPTDNVARGTLFAPMHWTRQRSSAGWINGLVETGTDPVSGQPALKSGRVQAERFAARWYGFLATSELPVPVAAYCAVARTQTGWQVELAGETDMPDAHALLSKLTRQSGEVSEIDDAQSRLRRLALSEDGRITALLFLAPSPVALSRGHVVSLIGQDHAALPALAGAPSQDAPDAGPVICACNGVGRNTVAAAISAGARTLDAIGAATCAGSGCGSCRPELAAMIPAETPALAAE